MQEDIRLPKILVFNYKNILGYFYLNSRLKLFLYQFVASVNFSLLVVVINWVKGNKGIINILLLVSLSVLLVRVAIILVIIC